MSARRLKRNRDPSSGKSGRLSRGAAMARKIVLPLVIVAGAVSFAGYLRATKPPVERKAVQERVWVISAASVSFRTVQPDLKLYGEVVAGRKVELRPLVSGRVVKVGTNFVTGGTVQKGDLLIEIDAFEYKATVSERTAQFQEAQARLEEILSDLTAERTLVKRDEDQVALRKREVDRRARLRARGSGSQKAADDSRIALNSAEQQLTARKQAIARLEARAKQQSAVVDRSKVALERAQRDLRETVLRSPFDGFIVETDVAVGKRVGTNDRVARLIDARHLEVKFQMSDREFGRLAAAGGYRKRPATVEWVTGGKTFTFPAVIERVASEVEANAGGVNLFARIKDTDTSTVLRPGIFVEVSVKDRAYDRVARVPNSAIHGGNTVYVVVGERLRSRKVEVVARVGNGALVRGEIKANDRILVSRFAEVGDGVRVQVR